jgi:RHH-type rel operon transcriptional repressor/antitoxin RelB
MLAVRLQPEIEARLDALAKKTGRTKTHFVREAIEEYLEEMEDYYRAETSWREAQKDGKRYTLQEARNELGL